MIFETIIVTRKKYNSILIQIEVLGSEWNESPLAKNTNLDKVKALTAVVFRVHNFIRIPCQDNT